MRTSTLKNPTLRRMAHAGAAALIAAVVSTGAAAQEWRPTEPVTLIVPSSPGGGHDNTARVLAKVMEKHAGQPINVINQPAGGGVVAYTEMMSAPTDGHTLGQVSTSLVSDKYRIEGVEYGPESYAYIGQMASDPNHLIVMSDGPYGEMTAEEFIQQVKETPGKVPMGVSGNWGNQDYTRYQIEAATDTEFLRVPIKGGRNIMLSMLAGDVATGLLYPSEIKAQVEAGEIKVLAHNGDEPLDLWPDVPTFESLGLEVNLPVWRLLVVPKETSAEIVAGWTDILAKTMQDPELKEAYRNAGIGYAYKDAEATQQLVERAEDTYRQIIEEAGLAIEAATD